MRLNWLHSLGGAALDNAADAAVAYRSWATLAI